MLLDTNPASMLKQEQQHSLISVAQPMAPVQVSSVPQMIDIPKSEHEEPL